MIALSAGGRWPRPVMQAIVSTGLAACALSAALLGTRAPSEAALRERSLTQSPERVAEAFILAFDAHDFERAAGLATEPLQGRMRARAHKHAQEARPHPNDDTTFLIEESYFLSEGRLRLVGTLTRQRPTPTQGSTVAILVGRRGNRFLVENLSWPRGPIPELP